MIDGTRFAINDLPYRWRWTELGKIASFVNGDRGRNYPSPADRVAFGIPFINTGHIEPTGRLGKERMDYITREKFDKLGSGKVRPGDIVYCLRGSTIGKIARNEFPEGAIASSLVIIRAEERALQQFIYFYLASPIGQTLAKKFDNGSAQPNLSTQVISKYPIPLPPQDQLIPISQLLAGLDDKIELNRRINETLEAMAQAIFRDWFVDFGPTRRKVEGASNPVEIMGGLVTDAERAQQLADLFPARFGDNGLPEGWRNGELGDLVSNVVERCKPSVATQALPYVPIDTIDPHKLVLSKWRPGEEAQSSLVRFKRNDVLFGAMRPYFHKVAVSSFDGVTRTTVFVLRPRLQADLYFAACQINEPSSIEYATLHSSGSTIPYAVWSNSFEKLPVVLPPKEIRRKYGEFAAEYIGLMDLNEGQNRTLSSTRDLLFPKLLSGEIRLQDTDEILEAAQ